MPKALCSLVTSHLVGINDTLSMPCSERLESGSMGILTIVSGLLALKGTIVWMISSRSKCFHPRMIFADAGVAKMGSVECLGRVQRVWRLQWSGLSWLMMIKSTLCRISAMEVTAGGSTWLLVRK